MPAFAVTYQCLNADGRRAAYAAQFNVEFASQAMEYCKIVHGEKPGFALLTIAPMK